MQKAFKESSADQEIMEDKWGYSLSGYAPIRDKEGKTIAILGVDLAAPAILETKKQFQRNFILVFFICLTIAFFFSWLLTEQLVKQLEEFVEASKKIQTGDFNHRFTFSTIEEVNILSQSFNAMLNEICATHSKRKEELEFLQEISRLTISEITLQEVLQRIVDIIVSVVGAERCSLRTYEEKWNRLVLQASYSLTKEYIEANQIVTPKNSFFQVVKTKKVLVVNNLSTTEHRFPGLKDEEKLGSAVAVPLIAKDKVLGLILVHSSTTNYYGPSEVELLVALANIIAVADAFDAMTSDRSYRKSLSVLEALREIKRCEDTQFDPQVVEAFLVGWERQGKVIKGN